MVRSLLKWLIRLVVAIIFIAFIVIGYILISGRDFRTRVSRIGPFMENPIEYEDWQIIGGQRCGDAPFLMPTTGYIGVGWNDGVRPLYQHTGFDIFSPDGADNVTPIYAVFDGYLTRDNHWRSAVIIRHPELNAAVPELAGDETLWTYYTHMASQDGEESFISADYPRGTHDKFVAAGTLLGYQGSWSGSERVMSRHLHLSVVKSDAFGNYLNETEIGNTIDPTPFLGLTKTADNVIKCLQ